MSSTMTIRMVQPTALEKAADLYSIPEDKVDEKSKPSTPKRPSTAGGGTAPYPMYPGLQMAAMDRTRSMDAVPTVLNRPKRISGRSTQALATMRSHESLVSRSRVPSWGGEMHYESPESTGWRPGYGRQQHSPSLKKHRSRARLGEVLASLPGEILEVILEMLRQIHLDSRSESCASCWMRDACNVSLCSRKWSKAARLVLYRDIQLVGADSTAHKKKFKMAQGSRLCLLRRTLRSDPELASAVRTLKVPVDDGVQTASNLKGASPLQQYEDNVAALVMACPNLERLSGPMFSYGHSFKKLFHALSTRTKLKDMNWLIEPSALTTQQAITSTSSKDCISSTNVELQTSQEIAFLEQHRGWTKLTTLTIECLPEATLAPETLLARTLTVLPSLQHLHLCNLPANAFNDTNLLSLPALQSLTLSNIRGISSNGLSSFATRPNSQKLRKLQLRHTPLTSLPALARIFSNLPSLRNFALVQSFPPLMPESESFILWMMPYLASTSLSKLHWDITSHLDTANTADDLLARSIEAGGFPCLRTLRTPNDPDGLFQKLCRPVEGIALASDRFRNSSSSGDFGSRSAPSSPTKHLAKSSTSRSLPSMVAPTSHTNLVAARLAAQTRLDKSRDLPLFQVHVTDEQGSLVEEFGLAGYVGTVGSSIEYHLLPDAGATDESGGLLDVPSLRSDAGESLADGKEGCSGSWNWQEGAVADKKEKERWWHTERGRWNRVTLD